MLFAINGPEFRIHRRKLKDSGGTIFFLLTGTNLQILV